MSARAPFAPALAVLLTLAAPSRVAAEGAPDPSAEPISVSLEGHAGCGDAELFLRQILFRTSRARRAEPGESARSFAVRIVQRPPYSSGTLVIRDAAAGNPAQREVTAATCDEVIAALALVAALTIDPHATTTPIEKPADVPPPEPAPPPASAPSASAPVPKPAPRKPAAPNPAPAPITHEDAGVQRKNDRARLGAQAAVELMSGIAPEIVVLPRALVELELASLGPSWVAPSARLSAARGKGSGSVEGVGNASFVWTGARIELCPVRAAAAGWYARPCLGFEAAALKATGEDLPETRSELRPWLAPLAMVRTGWRWPFGLGIELYGGASLPLVDDDFQFNDRRTNQRPTVHKIPSVSFVAGLALGLSGEVF